MPCDVADGPIGKIVEAVEPWPRWEEELLTIISVNEEVREVKKAGGRL